MSKDFSVKYYQNNNLSEDEKQRLVEYRKKCKNFLFGNFFMAVMKNYFPLGWLGYMFF